MRGQRRWKVLGQPVRLLAVGIVGGLPCAACVSQDPRDAASLRTGSSVGVLAANQPVARRAGDSYYLARCAVCPGHLGARGETVDDRWNGRELRFCSQGCRSAFELGPDEVISRLDEVMIADQAPFYPDSTSIVSGRPLGKSRVMFIWSNRLIQVADQTERDRFLADPETYIRVLDKTVISRQSPTYGMLDKCPVQGDILPSDTPLDIVVANRMIRVCCGRCANAVRARPSQYLSMVEYANREALSKHGELPAPPP